MVHWTTDSDRDKRRVDQALDILRQALIKYLGSLPRGSRRAYGGLDLQRLLNAFIDRFPELTLPTRTRTLAFAAKDARNEVAHYTGAMTPHDALRHLANVRQLLKDLDADAAFGDVDGLYGEHLDGRGPDVVDKPRKAVAPVASPAQVPNARPAPRSSGVKGKYGPLYGHLLTLADDQWDATFREVEAVLGGPLPASARKHPAWWSKHGQPCQWQVVARRWLADAQRADRRGEGVLCPVGGRAQRHRRSVLLGADLLRERRHGVPGVGWAQSRRLRRQRASDVGVRLRRAAQGNVHQHLGAPGTGCLHGAVLPQVLWSDTR